MTALLIDIGNTRIKWARSRDGRLEEPRQATHRGDVAVAIDAVRGELDADLRRVVVANVAGAAMADALTAAVMGSSKAQPRFLVSRARECGVTNSYAEPERLGVDRWAALIAGHSMSQSTRPGAPSCIIGAGTAVTFDAVRGDGQHLGGLIVASARLQTDALARRTSDIGAVAGATAFPGAGLELLGRSTEQGVAHGAWLAIAGALTQAFERVERALAATPMVYLCGGDAVALRGWIDFPVRLREHLVLEGLDLMSRGKV